MQVSRKLNPCCRKHYWNPWSTMTETNQSPSSVTLHSRDSEACIIQDGHPIAFVSKSLTDTETWYANIKRELLAIMYGCEKFHTYLYGRTFWLKQTTNCWRWSVWRILLQPQLGYRGCFFDCNSMTWQLHTDQARRCSWLMPSAVFLHRLTHKSSSTSELMPYWCQLSQGAAWWRLQQKHNEIQSYQQFTDWHWMVGLPDAHQHVPRIARNYWDFRDELSIEDDLLMKGEWVIIPPSCRDSIMDDLHKSHAGIQQGIGLGKNVCLLARNGSWCDRLYQEDAWHA